MLKQLRDMNADTTSAAISSSAEAASAAAAATAAANLPNIKKLDLGAGDFVELSVQKKKMELAAFAEAEKAVRLYVHNRYYTFAYTALRMYIYIHGYIHTPCCI